MSKWVEQAYSCTGDENSTKNWKNQLDFIWKDFDSRSWRNKSHLVLWCISWDYFENKFSRSTMKSWSHEVRWKKKLEFWWKNALCFENGVRSLSFLTLKSFHTSQTSMRRKFLETQTKSSQLSKISSKLSFLVSPLVLDRKSVV